MYTQAAPISSMPFCSGAEPSDWEAISKALLNATGDGVVAIDPEGTILFANRVARETLGLLPGVPLKEVYPELWPEAAQTLLDSTSRLGITVCCEGACYLVKICPIIWKSKLMGVLCVFENCSTLEKSLREMQAFQRLNRQFDAIFNCTSDGLWVSDGNGVVIRINSASERLNRIRADQAVGRRMEDIVSEGIVDRSATLEVLKTKSIVNILQRNSAGRKLFVTGNPFFDEKGSLELVVTTERDITELDRLYQELDEQEAISDQFRRQMLEMQMTELEARTVIARSPSMIKALRQALKVSTVDSNVLILGESGVGKGLIADLIHKYSSRAQVPMIKINCGAIPESLVESELFGYERGAFTGAHKGGKPGQFELADRGIVFLDEIAELPFPAQVKLLRFLEDGLITRIGGTASRRTNVRILAATNRDLESMVQENRFRSDLYYRLNVIPIHIPALRERQEDILPLLQHCLERFKIRSGVEKLFSRAVLDALLAYSYPGNVRELINLCERLVVMSDGNRIDLEDLPPAICPREHKKLPTPANRFEGKTLAELMDSYEKTILARAIGEFGNQQRAAAALGVNQSTIARKLNKHGLR